MFFSIPFPKFSLVAHCSWDEQSLEGELRIFTNNIDAQVFKQQISDLQEAEALNAAREVLPEESDFVSLQIKGDAALSLGRLLAGYANLGIIEHESINQDARILSIRDRTDDRVPGECIIMFFDGRKHFVAIVQSKIEGQQLLESLVWLNEEERARHLEGITKWNSPDDHPSPTQMITDAAAELLCLAHVVRKLRRFDAQLN